jgi:hypothetical protein
MTSFCDFVKTKARKIFYFATIEYLFAMTESRQNQRGNPRRRRPRERRRVSAI